MEFRRFAITFLLVSMATWMGGQGCSCDDSAQVADEPNLAYEPLTVSFGTVAINTEVNRTVTLKNTGTSGTIRISSIYLDNLGDEFTLTLPEQLTLDPYSTENPEEIQVVITYHPTNTTADSGYLVIDHNVAQQGNRTKIPIAAAPPVAELLADPNPIDFDEVDSGSFATIDVTLTNVGTNNITINDVDLRIDGSKDFNIEGIVTSDGTELPKVLAPKEYLGVVVQYTPTEGGPDVSTMNVSTENNGANRIWAFEVTGKERGPYVVFSPAEIDFGWVTKDKTEKRIFELTNEGNSTLVIPAGGIRASIGSDADLVVGDGGTVPDEEVEIEVGEAQTFDVYWTAREVRDTDSLGAIAIETNDSGQGIITIPVKGNVDAPLINVMPTKVDFGYGAMMTPVQRQVTITNNGHGNLDISNIEIIDHDPIIHGIEFEVVADATFPPTMSDTTGTIEGYGFKAATITFTNRGPDTGKATATLVIESNSTGSERIEIPMTVQRSGAPVCNMVMVPPGVNFGTVANGFPSEKEVRLANTGTGPCTFKGFKMADCSSGMLGMTGWECSEPLQGANSTMFKLLNYPSIGEEIVAGKTISMKVQFNPPESSPLFGLLNSYGGLLSFNFEDTLLKTKLVLPNTCPETTDYMGNTTVQCQPNILGSSGIAKVSVLPDHIDFGVVTIGCFSKTYQVCVYNSGNAPLLVNDIKLAGCTPEFKMKNLPALPRTVQGGTPACFEAVYAPVDEGKDKCIMQMAVTDKSSPTVAIALKGEGTYETDQIDEFTQVSGQEVDIMFVIDDSGSMCDEQTRLSSSFSDFISHAGVWNNDYHIGVISVNVVDDEKIGRLNVGDASVTPRYITPTTQSQSTFGKLINIGCSGGSDSQEAGLQASQAALAAPLTTDTEVACSSTAECANDPNICPDPNTCPYYCIDGTCGGWNKGFLREDAQLEIVALSDEEDQSSQGLPFYIDYLKNIKGWYNSGMMHFNAIVGVAGVPDSPSSGNDGDCVAPDGGTAYNGQRYIDAATETGGLCGSICEDSFNSIMNLIGDQTFSPKVQFRLTRLADPATVEVKVNNVECTKGWRYDSPSNSIIFDVDGECMPEAGDKIWVHYETLCLTS